MILSRRNRLYYQRFCDQYCLHLQGDFLMSRANIIQFSVPHNIAQKKYNFRKDLRHTLSFKRIKTFILRTSGGTILFSFTTVLIFILISCNHLFFFQLSRYRDGLWAGLSGFNSRQVQDFSTSSSTGSEDHPASYSIGNVDT
jgi:hypothetical protein